MRHTHKKTACAALLFRDVNIKTEDQNDTLNLNLGFILPPLSEAYCGNHVEVKYINSDMECQQFNSVSDNFLS